MNSHTVLARILLSYCFQRRIKKQTDTYIDKQRWEVGYRLSYNILMLIAALKYGKRREFWGYDECVPDGTTDGPTDQRTDRPSYRDARTHLKSLLIDYG